jgi:hypothetical protein
MVSLGVTMALGAVLLVVLLNRDDGQNNASGSTPGSTASAETNGKLAPEDGGAPEIPGWRAYNTGGGAIFDAPPSWKVTMETDENGNRYPTARYKPGVCGDPENMRGIAYTAGIESTDPHQAVTQMVQQTSTTAVSSGGTPQISQGPIEEIPQRGFYTTATFSVPPAGPESCSASTVVMHLVAAESTTGYIMLVVLGDQGVPDAPANEELAQIAKSFRSDAG